MFVVYSMLFLQWMYIVNGQTVQSAIRCYGTGWVMDESCPANHKIFPVEVRVGSLALSTGCPDNIVKGTDLTKESNCCTRTDSGCIDTYRNTQNGSVTYVYHENCMGRQSCISFSVVRSTTTGPVVYCDQSLYHSTTTVLEMRYQCIEDDQFFTPANAGPSSKLGLYSVHITLQDYAVSAIPPMTTNMECSVESSECDGQINIIAKDLRLYSSGGQCFQNISINETGIGVINTFNCDDNTNFIQNLNFFKSQTNHIILTFTNSHQQPGGYFWIQLVSANSTHTLSVNCPPVEEDPRCNPTTEPPTTTAEITSTTAKNTAANNGTIQKPEQPSSNDNSEVIAAVVSIVVAAIIVALVIIIYKFIYKKKCKREGYDDEQQISENPSPTTSHTTISDVHFKRHSVQSNPALTNRYTGNGQVPPRGHQSSVITASPSEHINVSSTGTTKRALTETPLPDIPSSKTQNARSLVDEADQRQKELGRSLVKPIETRNEQIPGHMSSTRPRSSEQNDETVRGHSSRQGQLPPIENKEPTDQSNETTQIKKKKKKKKHHKNRVSATDIDPQNDTTENQSRTDMENQDEIINEIEDQDFTSTHERGNAENESDATKKKKKKKKKKKSKNVELDEDPYDKTEPV
eukprot:XP_011451179.1 PREDICTED: uncharacterized protein LOC105344948 [Crassostrea gigas]